MKTLHLLIFILLCAFSNAQELAFYDNATPTPAQANARTPKADCCFNACDTIFHAPDSSVVMLQNRCYNVIATAGSNAPYGFLYLAIPNGTYFGERLEIKFYMAVANVTILGSVMNVRLKPAAGSYYMFKWGVDGQYEWF